MPWPTGDRDTTKFLDVELIPPQFKVDGREHLKNYMLLDNVDASDKANLEQITGVEGSRFRTFRKMYERLGLIYEDGGRLYNSTIGQLLSQALDRVTLARQDWLNEITDQAVHVLSRYQYRNPAEPGNVQSTSTDFDIQPFLAIWKSMLSLDDKIHYEELNRVLLHVEKMVDLPSAIEHICNARKALPSYRGATSLQLDTNLGPQVIEDQAPARIAALMSNAGWGGLIITSKNDPDGFRHLVTNSRPYVVSVISSPPTFYTSTNEKDWFKYYLGPIAPRLSTPFSDAAIRIPIASIPILLDKRIKRMVHIAITNSHAVMLVGPPGTGKTTILKGIIADIKKDPHLFGFTKAFETKWVTPEESWTTRELIGGETIAPDGELRFRPGYVLNAVANDQWLVLDEANRADMDKIFGGLLTWLSGYSVELGRSSTGIHAVPVILEWNDKPHSEFCNLDLLSDDAENSSPIVYRVGQEWRLLGTYNGQDAQRVFRFGQALGRRFVRVPIPVMARVDFERVLAPMTDGLPRRVHSVVVGLYDLHSHFTTMLLGPALFFWIPDYVRSGLNAVRAPNIGGVVPSAALPLREELLSETNAAIGSSGVEDAVDAPKGIAPLLEEMFVSTPISESFATASGDSDREIDELLAEAYLATIGVWLARLDESEFDELQREAINKNLLSPLEWTWIKTLLPTLA